MEVKNLIFIGSIGVILFFSILFSPRNYRTDSKNGEKKAVYSEAKEQKDKLKTWPLNALIFPRETSPKEPFFVEKRLEELLMRKFDDFANGTHVFSGGNSGNQMSDSEIFEIMWPIEYRTELKKVEDLLAREGFVNASIRNAMASDQDMLEFYKILLVFARKKLWVTEKQYSNFYRGITEVLPSIMAREKIALQRKHSQAVPLPGSQRVVHRGSELSLFTKDVLDGLKYVFSFAEPADAAWFTTTDCYKDDIPPMPIMGPNLWAFCCNCGFYCVGPYCVEIEDCQQQSVACNVPLGCLNLMCGTWPQAIWDPEFGVCGCG